MSKKKITVHYRSSESTEICVMNASFWKPQLRFEVLELTGHHGHSTRAVWWLTELR